MKELIYKENKKQRIDIYVSDNIKELSRSQIQKLIKAEEILVNNKQVKSRYILKIDDFITINMPSEEEEELKAIDYPIEVIYQDDYLAIVNKPAGMVVYPGAGKEKVSLVAALKGMDMPLSTIYEEENRNGIVHRLDKDTSGLMMIAKDNDTHEKLSALLKKREVVRKYYAMVSGQLEHDFGTIDAPIGRDERNRVKRTITSEGKEAKTYFTVKERFDNFSFLECELYSGRTHQIRVHMRYIKHPILADPLYGHKDKYNLDSLLLQSCFLEFVHPQSQEKKSFRLEVRDDFKKLMQKWRK